MDVTDDDDDEAPRDDIAEPNKPPTPPIRGQKPITDNGQNFSDADGLHVCLLPDTPSILIRRLHLSVYWP
jgi:hypothetical protein